RRVAAVAARRRSAAFGGGGRAPARRHPELIERMAAAGHALGNHTWDHLSLPSLKRRFRRRQLSWTQEVLGPHASGLFRPPYGEQSLGSRLDAFALGLKVVCWDV